ncbi:glycosyltransferase [bacterium]|nr:glycosyltransferase [bacterium]
MSGLGDMLQGNLDVLRNAGRVDLFEQFAAPLPLGNLVLEQAKDGNPTLLCDGQAVHSRYAPQKEARSLASKLLSQAEGDSPVYLLGMGLGYLAEALIEAMPNRTIHILEPSVEAFSAAIQVRDLGKLFERCTLHVGNLADVTVDGSLVVMPSVRVYAPFALDEVKNSKSEKGLVPPGLRILVVGALLGGSVPIGHYVTSALKQLGHRAELFDSTPFAPAKAVLENVSSNQQHRTTLLAQYTNLLGQSVLARAEEMQAQLVFFMAQSPGTQEALEELRRAGVPTAFWFVEDGELFEYGVRVAPFYDVFFHIQKGSYEKRLRQAGAPAVHYLPLAADPDVHKSLELNDSELDIYGSDISHMGAGYFNRRHFFSGLTDYDFKLWGSDWEGAGLLAAHLQKHGERVDQDEIIRIFNATRINLNLHSSTYTEGVNPNGDFVNPRTFEVASCGAFQLVDERSLLAELFEPGKEVVTFNDLESCRKAIDYYLAHPDEAKEIAVAARRRVLEHHTYRHRMDEALRVIAAQCEFPAVEENPNMVRALVLEAGDDQELASFFARMGEPDDVLTLDGIAQKILREEGDLGETEALFLLMNEFGKWAKEKGVV